MKMLSSMGLAVVLGAFMVQGGHTADGTTRTAVAPCGSGAVGVPPPDAGAKCATWPAEVGLNSCRISDVTVTINPGGKVSWSAVVQQVGPGNVFGGDAYCTSLFFLDQNGTPVFSFPRICSGTLSNENVRWARSNLGVPALFFGSITAVSRADHC